MPLAEEIPLDEFFSHHDHTSRELFDAVRAAVESIGEASVRATTSQVAFRRRIAFAWTWVPRQYLQRGAPLVLTLDLHRRDPSRRWKEVIEVRPGRFTHHLELTSAEQVDDEVLGWLREAWQQAE